MNKHKQLGFQSALLVSYGIIILFFAGAILCWCISFNELAVMLISLSVIGLISRLWGNFALESLAVEIKDTSTILSVGQSITTHYIINNNKLLPLIWLDLCLDVPFNHCIKPGSEFKEVNFSQNEAEYLHRDSALVRRIAFLGSYSSIEWDSVWTGERRGVYIPKSCVLRSGDGFGLSQSIDSISDFNGKCYVIWPKLVTVNTNPLVTNTFSGSTGKKGYYEDPSILRNERQYIPSDQWKKIDWRTAARTDELMVKEYETIMPQSFLFILDIQSFEDKEEAISILASLLFELNRQGFKAGISLPATKQNNCLTIKASENSLSESMYTLAEIDADTAGEEFDRESIYSNANAGSKIWIVSDNPKSQSMATIMDALRFNACYSLSKTTSSDLKFREVLK